MSNIVDAAQAFGRAMSHKDLVKTFEDKIVAYGADSIEVIPAYVDRMLAIPGHLIPNAALYSLYGLSNKHFTVPGELVADCETVLALHTTYSAMKVLPLTTSEVVSLVKALQGSIGRGAVCGGYLFLLRLLKDYLAKIEENQLRIDKKQGGKNTSELRYMHEQYRSEIDSASQVVQEKTPNVDRSANQKRMHDVLLSNEASRCSILISREDAATLLENSAPLQTEDGKRSHGVWPRIKIQCPTCGESGVAGDCQASLGDALCRRCTGSVIVLTYVPPDEPFGVEELRFESRELVKQGGSQSEATAASPQRPWWRFWK